MRDCSYRWGFAGDDLQRIRMTLSGTFRLFIAFRSTTKCGLSAAPDGAVVYQKKSSCIGRSESQRRGGTWNVSVSKVVVNWGEAGAWSQSVVIGSMC
jgi:hypothetical protein